jgi:carboxypeptidase Taq
MKHPDAVSNLAARLKRAHVLDSVLELLDWDEQVNLPPDSGGRRAEQTALLAGLAHEAATDPQIGELLAALEVSAELLDDDGRVLLREARRDYDKATRLPTDFVTEKAALDSEAFLVWQSARAAADFQRFAPYLERQLAMARREAAYAGMQARPYDYFLDHYNPGMGEGTITALFAELRSGVVPLVQAIVASPVVPRDDLLKGFPVAAQQALLREVTAALGFDFRRGRIDVAAHPFCSGDAADTRLTTRFKPEAPLSALFSAIHESGHGMYEQGLPLEHLGTPLGTHAGMAVHESQSRLWENQVGRGRAFWRHFEPRLRALFPEGLAGVSTAELYLAINAVRPGVIRVEADEVTYNLHILLRFALEQQLFAGDLAVRDLPAAWNAASAEMLGLTPGHAGEGVLQDVHWSRGKFGYFPSYCLGNMIAAQLWETVRTAMPDLEDDFARGDFTRLLSWLRNHVHVHGRRHDTPALVRRATGHELSAAPLLRYLRERYAALYLSDGG